MKVLKGLLCVLIFATAAHAQDTARHSDESLVKLLPVLWQQQAAEYRALCYQAFNVAAMHLEKLPARKKKEPLAIVTDLDETILDNSYHEASLIKNGESYTAKGWKQWTDKSAATALPGAVEFLQAAKKKGINIFYISNRDTSEIKSTLMNMQKLLLPDADTEHLLFLNNTSSKEERRRIVSGKYKVIMLLGDNLNDFTQLFDKKSSDDRKAEVDKAKNEWGRTFIVLPNATYGEWENALYNYERNLTPTQKVEKLKKKLVETSK